jgi:GH25 family lysozyme M1 (1,4-beta-N-acetylmuramidase)
MRVFSTLKRGDKSAEVKFLQRSLPAWAWPMPVCITNADGAYGSVTEQAVKNYQSQLDLVVDGIAGPETLKSLDIYANVVPGIDISDYQTGIDWSQVAGIKFVYAKASEGATWKSREFASHYAGTRGAGFKFGAYHFARMEANTPWAEFDNFMSIVGNRSLDLPVALDLEANFGMSGQAATEWALAWLQEAERELKVRPVVYTSRRIITTELSGGVGLEAYPLWTPRWGDQPVNLSPWSNWSIWQYTNKSVVPGIPGEVDANHMVTESL